MAILAATATIKVQLRGGTDDIESPSMDKDEAERQLAVIRECIGTADAPELSWLAVQGRDILAASIDEGWER